MESYQKPPELHFCCNDKCAWDIISNACHIVTLQPHHISELFPCEKKPSVTVQALMDLNLLGNSFFSKH